MKKRLYVKVIGAYAILVLLCFFVASSLGSQLISDRLIQERAEDCYREAEELAGGEAASYYSSETSLALLAKDLTIIAQAENTDIRLIGTDGTVSVDTSRKDVPYTIDGFDYARFGPKYYEVSTFFDVYPNQHLTVMIPVTSGFTTRGYLSISTAIDRISAHTARLMRIVYIVIAVNLLMAGALVILFIVVIHRQLTELTRGAREYASGNLTHKIHIEAEDEIGELADSMNYMARQLKKSSDYQKQLISNISHDFRSPLTSIKGFTEAMIDGTIPPELHEKYLHTISREADRLAKLTREVLTLNSMDSDKLSLRQSDFDINTVLKNTVAVFEGSCRKKKISIRLVLTGETLRVHADQERIEQVLYNLLDNAIKFSDRNMEIKVETTEKYGKCYVSVKDEGCGISSQALPHIWDRFYKEDTSRGKDRTGTGLGLSIVKEIISAHGQNINVISTEGVGTEFIFTLALAKVQDP